MGDTGGLFVMAKKKPKGRPSSGVKPLRSLVSLKGSDDLEGWLDRLTEATGCATRSHTIRRALKQFAESNKIDDPMPKR